MTTRPKIVDELKAGLEGVTPGPYVFSGVRYKMNGGEWQNMFDGQDRAIIAVSINPRTLEGYKDGCHIARCSPDNISALIEWGESMERERDALRSALDLKSSNYAVQTVDLRSAVTRAEAAEAKVAELEAKLAARDDEEAELLSIAAMYGQKRGMDGLRELKAENERLREALLHIVQWADAYPVSVFPEPDFKKVRELLAVGGIALDVVSASNMRHVVKGVGDIARAALDKGERDV